MRMMVSPLLEKIRRKEARVGVVGLGVWLMIPDRPAATEAAG